MKLYEIINSLQNAQGSLAKQAILMQHKDNELFKCYMKAVYDVGLNYYIKKVPDVSAANLSTVDAEFIEWLVKVIAGREQTGTAAKTILKQMKASMDVEGQELMKYILDRSIGASVGDTMVLKTWPNLYFIPPYQRCSLMDSKAKDKFSKLKKFYVQNKADGSFAYIVKRLDGSVDVITRQGSTYPKQFAERMAYGVARGKVLVGELLVHEKQSVDGWGEAEYILDRKTGNGILNSALKDGEIDPKYSVKMQAWDLLTQEEFESGKSNRVYSDRMESLEYEVDKLRNHQIEIIESWEVASLEEAYKIYTEHTSRGLEGVIVSDPDDLWKDGTSKGKVKLKLKFEAEYRCTGLIEGEGKAKGMLGAASYTTEDGKMEFNCGTGFSDAQRKAFWNDPSLIVDKVSMLSANDVIQSRDLRKKPALSLPVFEEVRFDKNVANTLEEVEAILKAAKEGK